MNLDLSKIKKVFFIGIGGIGISALAKMMLSRGLEVAGVNDEESPKTLEPLRAAGARVSLIKESPHQKGMEEDFINLPVADLYIYSDAWIYRGPELIASARGSGKPTLSYFEALGAIASQYKVIAIAGTHGKTTTTAMIASILVDAGLDPTVVVGSMAKKFNSNFRAGKGEYLVVEADEYNRHFLNFHPFISVVTNIEADHLDYYKDLADVEDAFKKFISQSTYVVQDYAQYLEKVPKLSVPGEHNRMNAAAALAVADILDIEKEAAQKSLAEFSGTWRRLEERGTSKEGTIIYDDYSHHPTEVRAALKALRELHPGKHITVLFQPHLYSRTKALFDDFTKCFRDADRIMLLPIYFAREREDLTVSSEKLAASLRATGQNARAYRDFDEAEKAVYSLKLGSNDIFVTMGAGEAYRVANLVFPALPT